MRYIDNLLKWLVDGTEEENRRFESHFDNINKKKMIEKKSKWYEYYEKIEKWLFPSILPIYKKRI